MRVVKFDRLNPNTWPHPHQVVVVWGVGYCDCCAEWQLGYAAKTTGGRVYISNAAGKEMESFTHWFPASEAPAVGLWQWFKQRFFFHKAAE